MPVGYKIKYYTKVVVSNVQSLIVDFNTDAV